MRLLLFLLLLGGGFYYKEQIVQFVKNTPLVEQSNNKTVEGENINVPVNEEDVKTVIEEGKTYSCPEAVDSLKGDWGLSVFNYEFYTDAKGKNILLKGVQVKPISVYDETVDGHTYDFEVYTLYIGASPLEGYLKSCVREVVQYDFPDYEIVSCNLYRDNLQQKPSVEDEDISTILEYRRKVAAAILKVLGVKPLVVRYSCKIKRSNGLSF
jgi:hypothetical protein